ncbi:MAG: hypothetical protein D9V44_09760 [Actinobacteria bacterium]|nr:MAG: hypothetical protein D9V44_09760 [Actinomycetota bacterium]
MPFEEKVTWVNLLVSFAVPIAYASIVYGQLGATPVAEIAYQRTLVIAIVVSIVLTIVGSILAGVGSGIAIGIRKELTGEGSMDEVGRSDERDKDISRRGELIGYWVSSVGVIVALGLAMTRQDQFWIANSLYAGFVAASIASGIAKLVLYRRGF